MAVKWSDDSAFPEGGECRIGDKIVGLRDGKNTKFDFPSDGIKDGNENYLIKWATVGGSASNYLLFQNGQGGVPTEIRAQGSDLNININIEAKGSGVISANGLFTINGSQSLNGFINDDTMTSASVNNVPTSQSIVNYIASLPPVPGGVNTQVQYNDNGLLNGDTGFTTDGNGTLSITTELSVSNLRLNGNTLSSTDVNGDINLQPNGSGAVLSSGFWDLNSSTPIDAVINDGTMAAATASNVPTAQSVVTYVASLPTNAGGSNTQIQYNNLGGLAGDTGFTTNGAGTLSVTGLLNVDNLRIDANNISSTNPNGDVNVAPNGTGKFSVNSTVGIDAIIDDDTMASATDTNVPTSESVVNYIAATAGGAGGVNTNIQYNNSGSLDGDGNFTTNGTGNVSITGQLDVDNLQLNGNVISSTNVNGDIELTPNGSGDVVLKGVDWSGLTDGQLFIGQTGNVPALASLTGGNGIAITNSSGGITIDSYGRGQDWVEVTTTSSTMQNNKGYIANNAALVTLTLPATSAVGDVLVVQGKGAGKWRIAQNAGQSIVYSDKTTTVGVGGSLTPAKQYDSVQLVCITANTVWAVHTAPTATYTAA